MISFGQKRRGLCFVRATHTSDSTRWLLYPAKHLGAAASSVPRLCAGYDLDYATYVVERETWLLPWNDLRGARVVAWLDDAYHLLPQLSINYRGWKTFHSDFVHSLRHCQALIAPSPYLVADYGDFLGPGGEAHFVPNYHDFPARAVDLSPTGLAHQGLGWAGSWNHWTSWRDTGLAGVLALLRGSLGYMTVVGTQQVYHMLKLRGVPVGFKLPMPHEDYLNEVGSWRCHLMPVQGEYDRRRSWCKALEAAYVGTPWLAVGDVARDVYREAQGGMIDPDAANLAAGELPQAGEAALAWAESMRVTKQLGAWQQALGL